MSSKAKLPARDREELLDIALDLMTEVSEILEELNEDERWRIWNLGGAAFGQPQFPGPGRYTAQEFADLSAHFADKLAEVKASFDHRRMKDAERRARWEAKRNGRRD